jgi:hypothetical protein
MVQHSTTGSGIHGLWRRSFVVLALSALVVVGIVAPVAQAKPGGATGTVKINAGAPYSSSTAVTLDSAITSSTQMRVRDAGGVYTSWKPYAASMAWVLPAGDGLKTVQVQYKRSTGKAITKSASITLDTTGPTTTDDYSGLPATVLTVTLTASADLSGAAETCYRIDGGAWHNGPVISLVLKVLHKRAGITAGVHTVEYYSVDGAGNPGLIGARQVTLG